MQNNIIKKLIGRELADLPKERRDAFGTALGEVFADRQTLLQEELIFGRTRSERRAWMLAFVSVLVAGGAVGLGLWGMSQSETQAYLTIVDKDTGIAERAVTIERAVLDQSDAVLQSLVHGYVIDRETFDDNDNEPRISDVFRRSQGPARDELQRMWDINHPEFDEVAHPPNTYGSGARVSVNILNITQISQNTAQVRFTKTLRKPGEATKEGTFVAVVSFAFKPETRNNVMLVWENPFGFYVTGYRITAEVSNDQ